MLLIAESFTNIPAETLARISRIELLQSAIETPRISFQGLDPYPTFAAKAASLSLAIARNHPLQDGNKRLAFLAGLQFAWINGFDLDYEIDDAEKLFFALAAGEISQEELTQWYEEHLAPSNQ